MNVYSKYIAMPSSKLIRGNAHLPLKTASERRIEVEAVPPKEQRQLRRELKGLKTDNMQRLMAGFGFTNRTNKLLSGDAKREHSLLRRPFLKAHNQGLEKTSEFIVETHPKRTAQAPVNCFANSANLDELQTTPKASGGSRPLSLESQKPLFRVVEGRAKEGREAQGLLPGRGDTLSSSRTSFEAWKRTRRAAEPDSEYGNGQFERNKFSTGGLSAKLRPEGPSVPGLFRKAPLLEGRRLSGLRDKEDRLGKFATSREDWSRSAERVMSVRFKKTQNQWLTDKEEVRAKVYGMVASEDFGGLVDYLTAMRGDSANASLTQVVNLKDFEEDKGLVHYALIFHARGLLQFLVECRADFHLKDKAGIIPLMISASGAWPETEELVIENTQDFNIQDCFGNTALHIAVSKSNIGFIEKLLRGHSVNIRQTNASNMKPLDLAEVSMVVRLQTLFKDYERQKGDNLQLSNSQRISNILSRTNSNPQHNPLLAKRPYKTPLFLKRDASKRSKNTSGNVSKGEHNFEATGFPKSDSKPSLENSLSQKGYGNLLERTESNVSNRMDAVGSKDEGGAQRVAKNTFELKSRPGFSSRTRLLNPVVGGGKAEVSGAPGGLRAFTAQHFFVKKLSEKQFSKGRTAAAVTPQSKPKVGSYDRLVSLGKRKQFALPRRLLHEPNDHVDNVDIEVIGSGSQTAEVKTFLKTNSHNHIPEEEAVAPPNELFLKKPTLSDFVIHGTIGKGSFGEVYLVQKKSNQQYFAMKSLSKKQILKENLTRYALTERNVLSAISHPFIVKLRFAFQNSKTLFLIMDFLPGGDLGKYLQRQGRVSEMVARIYAAEIILAISELHRLDIIFRDLKPENVLLDKDGHAMLCDFGLSKENVILENKERSFCGSVAYLAPEMLKKTGHGKAMDWYLVGVIIYEMVVGLPPFFAETKEELFNNIEHSTVKFPLLLTLNLKNLLTRLFEKDPSKRIKEEEVKAHPWFKGIDWEAALNKRLKPPKPIIKKIKTPVSGYAFPNSDRETQDLEVIENWTFVERTQDLDTT